MKLLFFLLCISLVPSTGCFGQSKTETIEVLQLKHKKYYRETIDTEKDSSLKIGLTVSYNEPKTMDEEYSRTLVILLKEPLTPGTSKTYDIVNDTLVLNCTYRFLSVWDWADQSKRPVTGKVTFRENENGTIDMNLNMIVSDRLYKENLVYRGHRLLNPLNHGTKALFRL